MTRSIFDPGGDTERSGSQFRSPDAANNSRMPKDVVDGEVSDTEAADLGVAPVDPERGPDVAANPDEAARRLQDMSGGQDAEAMNPKVPEEEQNPT